ncbi:MAG: hypothetical protein [Olavius algarvensis Gamma 3 endosymbiont]|nr:MAG: hypothetical protein [Olavius algarvensis Gamma 3 endosymbiont]
MAPDIREVNILIVDDHRLFAEGLSRLLETLDRPVVMRQCYSAQQAIHMLDASNTSFDLMLIDLLMPGIDGMGMLRAVAERRLSIPIAVVSSIDDTRTIDQLMASGAIGFIPKSVSSEVMLSAVTTLLNGDIYLPDELWGQLDFLDSGRFSAAELSDPAHNLGERQLEVLKLMAAGNTNKQISTILAISEATVKYHIGVL